MSFTQSTLVKTIKDFSLTEKILFFGFGMVFLVSGLALLFKQADFLFISTPAYGGSLSEGIVGYPRYVNPVLSITEAGRDITSLVYAGLLKENDDGSLSPDLAEDYTVSEDGLTYEITLKQNLSFHDGHPLTADDVVFTIEKIKDPNLKSPEYMNWQGVTVNKIDDYHIQFLLRSAYSPFAHNLTIGILPKHIWEKINDDQFSFSSYNYEPIGAGPYQFIELKRDQEGLPIHYKLKAFKDYAGGQPYINNVTLFFFKDAGAAMLSLKNGRIDSLGGMANENLKELKFGEDKEIRTFELLRTFSVFFNQNQSPVLIKNEVRQALNRAVDREKMIDQVLGGYGTPEYSPVPARLLSAETLEEISGMAGEDENTRIEAAKEILTDNGWSQNADGIMEKKIDKATTTLSFTLSTSDNEGLQKTAELLKEIWGKIGAEVNIQTYDAATLNQTIIRPRKYQALLFGEVIGHDADLYPFWHSSQRNDPGLNVAMYANVKADKAVEKARNTNSVEDRAQAYDDFNSEIMKDVPTVFLYSPQYIYVVPKKLQGFSSAEIETPQDRFDNMEKKYLEEVKVIKFFNKGNQ